MLSRAQESTARSSADIRIYAEKAAFEGQALRSMINGIQARTKHKLSDETKEFAERCYEQRLFFYCCEGLRVCATDAREECRRIISTTAPESDLRSTWSPLIDIASASLRKNELDSTSIRLSKLNDLWKKRPNSALLNSFVLDFARSIVDGKEKEEKKITSTVSAIINLSSPAAFQGGVLSTQTEIAVPMENKELRGLIVEIYIWGTIITQLTKNENIFNQEYFHTLPRPVTSIIGDIWNARHPYSHSQLDGRLEKYVEDKLIEQATSFWASLHGSNDKDTPKRYVRQFFNSRKLKLDVHYSIACDTRSELKFRVQLNSFENDQDGLKHFIELRHGLELSPSTRHSLMDEHPSVMKDCDNVCSLSRCDKLAEQQHYNHGTDLHSSPQQHTDISPTEDARSRTSKGVSKFLQNVAKFPKKLHDAVYNVANNVANNFANNVAGIPVKSESKDSEVETLIKERDKLLSEIRRLQTAAEIVSLVREPLDDSRRDIRCDGYVESAWHRIDQLVLEVSAIDTRLSSIRETDTPKPNPAVIKKIADRNFSRNIEMDEEHLRKIVVQFEEGRNVQERAGKKSGTYKDLVADIRKKFFPQGNSNKWKELLYEKFLINEQTVFALAPESVSDATPYLTHLQLVEKPHERMVQRSNRYLNDCSLYKPLDSFTADIEEAFNSLPGVSIEHFAELNPSWNMKPNGAEEALIQSAEMGAPLYLFAHDVSEHIARDLIETYSVFCIDPPRSKWRAKSVAIPIIYNPSLTEGLEKRNNLELETAIQSATLEYGTPEWIKWFASRLKQTGYHQSVFDFYRRTIAEREFLMRDEMLIERLRIELTNPNLSPPNTDLDRIRMDAYVNKIVETLIRGERIVNFNPPFSDADTADALARFIRCRRMVPDY